MTCAKLVAQNHACFDWQGCWEAAHTPLDSPAAVARSQDVVGVPHVDRASIITTRWKTVVIETFPRSAATFKQQPFRRDVQSPARPGTHILERRQCHQNAYTARLPSATPLTAVL